MQEGAVSSGARPDFAHPRGSVSRSVKRGSKYGSQLKCGSSFLTWRNERALSTPLASAQGRDKAASPGLLHISPAHPLPVPALQPLLLVVTHFCSPCGYTSAFCSSPLPAPPHPPPQTHPAHFILPSALALELAWLWCKEHEYPVSSRGSDLHP